MPEYVREQCSGCDQFYMAHPKIKRGPFCKKCINDVVNSYTEEGWSIKKSKVYHPCRQCKVSTVSTKWQVIASGGWCRACERDFQKRWKERCEQRRL